MALSKKHAVKSTVIGLLPQVTFTLLGMSDSPAENQVVSVHIGIVRLVIERLGIIFGRLFIFLFREVKSANIGIRDVIVFIQT